jgi:pimeloyl-ACP methyl ester carboxylesterase
VPILLIQGEDDEYGTVAQLDLVNAETYCPVETMLLKNCSHTPQFDQPEATLSAIAAFAHRILTIHEGVVPAA